MNHNQKHEFQLKSIFSGAISKSPFLPYVVIDINVFLERSKKNNFLGKLLLGTVVQKFSGKKYPPSRHAVTSFYESTVSGLDLNPIHGCIFTRRQNFIYVFHAPPVHSQRGKVVSLSRHGRLFQTMGALVYNMSSYSIAINASEAYNHKSLKFGVGFKNCAKTSFGTHKWPKSELELKLNGLPCIFRSLLSSESWVQYASPHEQSLSISIP